MKLQLNNKKNLGNGQFEFFFPFNSVRNNIIFQFFVLCSFSHPYIALMRSQLRPIHNWITFQHVHDLYVSGLIYFKQHSICTFCPSKVAVWHKIYIYGDVMGFVCITLQLRSKEEEENKIN